ncbi:MAG: glycosyltransferase family 4 protein [Patescibacteria group bacterium]
MWYATFMRVLITTGIYPPQIGGPAQYAKRLAEAFVGHGQEVSVATYGRLLYLPTGVRHLFFFFRILPKVWRADVVLALDTFSVGVPSVLAGKILGKKVVIRTGGDFLWEGYVELTGKKVLLRNFYESEMANLNLKEKKIFALTKWVLKNTATVVFSTAWQKDIWQKPYGLEKVETDIVENFYGEKEIHDSGCMIHEGETRNQKKMVFVGFTRALKWKNVDTLTRAFAEAKKVRPGLVLDLAQVPYEQAMEKIKNARCAILVSLGDISPNFALDALRLGVPIILTTENGITDRVGAVVRLVDPLDQADITQAILEMTDDTIHATYVEKIGQCNYVHTWEDIAKEFLTLFQKLA